MSNHPEHGASSVQQPPIHRPLPSFRRAEDLLAASDRELAAIDPVLMNLLVAKGVPSLHELDVSGYQRMMDEWAEALRQKLPAVEANFWRTPHRWKNDIRFARLAAMCWYIDKVLGIRYHEDQRHMTSVFYTDPGDLFLHGVMDSRQGTCANMSMVHVALAWRLGWPVSLACIGSHFLCRYDDGEVTHNIEATTNTGGGFTSAPDEYYLKEYKLSEKAVRCGSDLRAVRPRELLGLFFGVRARHFDNTHRFQESEVDYLLARHLFPLNRYLHTAQHQTTLLNAVDLFEPQEKGHPSQLARWIQQTIQCWVQRVVVQVSPWPPQMPRPEKETSHAAALDAFFSNTLPK